VGLTCSVLLTGQGRHPGQIAGRSPWLQPVHLPGPPGLIGTEVPVAILAAHPNSLSGTLAAGAGQPHVQQTEETAPA
jgi:tRNA-2-methylthio-N6-dimethylallyladenosine synthase